MDCSPSGSSVHGILQARILEWVAMPSSRDLPDPGIKFESFVSPALAGGSLPLAPSPSVMTSDPWGRASPSTQPTATMFIFFSFGCVRSLVVAHGLSCPAACGILVPQPGIEPLSPALGGRFSTPGPPGKSPPPQCCPRPCPSPELPVC